MAERARTGDGAIPYPALQWWQERRDRRNLGRLERSSQRSFHVAVLRHALFPNQRPKLQGLLSISESSPSQPSRWALLTSADHQDLRLRRARDLSHPGATICDRVHYRMCTCLQLRTLPRILLPHRGPRNFLRRRLCHLDLDAERWCTLLWRDTPGQWHLQRPQPATLLGDHSCSRPACEESRAGRYRQLCQPVLALVLAPLFPEKSGAILSPWRRIDPVRLLVHYFIMLCDQVVGEEAERKTGRSGRVYGAQWSRAWVAICVLRKICRRAVFPARSFSSVWSLAVHA